MALEPLESWRGSVEPGWVDYNDHMNVAYYVLAFDRGTDTVLHRLGIGEAYRRETGRSVVVAEAHVTYRRELKGGAPLAITSQLVDADPRRLHLFHRMHHGTAGWLAATAELMLLHVDLSGPRATPFADDAFARISDLLAAHRELSRPEELGRRIAIRR